MGLLDALRDDQFRSDVGRGLLDGANRGGVAGLLGGPVDLAALALRPFGYKDAQPIGGSEWIGQQMQNAGIVSGNRNQLAELLFGLVTPGAQIRAGNGLFKTEQAAYNQAKNIAMAAEAKAEKLVPQIMERGGYGANVLMALSQKPAYMLGASPSQQVSEILQQVSNLPKSARIGVRVLPDDVPTPGVGEMLRPSRKWIDGVQSEKELFGTSAMDITGASPQQIEQALKRLGLWNNAGQGYYPGNKLAIIQGDGKRKGEDVGEALIKNARLIYHTDLPQGPR